MPVRRLMAVARQLLGESILKHRWRQHMGGTRRSLHVFRVARLDEQRPRWRGCQMLAPTTGTFVRLYRCPGLLPRSENVRQRRFEQMVTFATADNSLNCV